MKTISLHVCVTKKLLLMYSIASPDNSAWIVNWKYIIMNCVGIILYSFPLGLSSMSERRDKHWYLFIFNAISGMLPLYRRARVTLFLLIYRAVGKAAFSVSALSARYEPEKTLWIRSLPSLGQFIQGNGFQHLFFKNVTAS